MADVSISLNNIRNTKSVYIDGIGGFTVRKLGAGEELDLSDKMRRLGVILSELQAIDFTKYDMNKQEDVKIMEKIQKRASKLSDEITEIRRFELNTYKRLFSDDKNGENVACLLNELSAEERSNLFKQVFEPVTPVETPEELKPEAEND